MKLRTTVQQHCLNALQRAFPDWQAKVPQDAHPQLIEVTEATQEQFGHYQCNSAMKLAKWLGASPREIATRMVAELQPELGSGFFSRADVAGPGFINLTLSTVLLTQQVNRCLSDARLGVEGSAAPRRVVVDFSSPNIAKEMHVGHLRSTIIGDAIARMLAFLGHDVLRLNHLGDWGTQFGMLITYIKQQKPELAQAAHPKIEATLSDLVSWYRLSKQRFDEDEAFKKQAQQEVVALQSGDPVSYEIWQQICHISRLAYQEIYTLLDVSIVDRGESFYNPWLAEVVSDFQKAHLLQESEGARCLFLEGFVNREGEPLPLLIQKSDGGYNYATTDLAAIRHRVREEKADWLIYVTDAGQAQHFAMVFQAAQKIGYADKDRVQLSHVPFGLVLRPDGKKFKTRSGDTERLIDLLNTAIEKAGVGLRSRNPELGAAACDDIAKPLGINSVKYADLSCHRTSNYVFSYDKMLQFEGNTAAFLSYALVRILSIQRKIGADVPNLLKTVNIELAEPAELSLALLICQFEDVLEHTVRELAPHRLTDYLFRLAEKFHRFFHDCRVEGVPQQNSRLLLCELVARMLRLGFELLGLKSIEKM